MTQDIETPTGIQRLVASPTVRSGYTSAVVHMLALIGLALFWIDGREPPRPRPIVIALSAAPESDESGAAAAEAIMPGAPASDAQPVVPLATADPEPIPAPEPVADVPVPLVPMETVMPVAAKSDGIVARPASLTRAAPPAGPAGDPLATAFARRSGADRGAAVRDRGGSAASEAAVERGLAWLARHQAADGSWRFDLSGCRCDGG
jgi:hypothetical protein